MTNQEIFDLIAHFERSSLSCLRLSQGDFSIELDRSGPVSPLVSAPAPALSTVTERHVVSAPLVGTYYAAPSPDAAPFVTVGDRVKKGQPLCLIEAMKMMSEIPAPCNCIITEIMKENGSLASFGEPLFGYQPC